MHSITKRFMAVTCIGLLLLSGCSRTNDTHPAALNPSNATTHTCASFASTTTAISTTHTTTTTSTSIRSLLTTATTQTTTSTTTTTTSTTPSTRPSTNKQESHLIDAPILTQRPDYPSGCESVSAVMLLQYWGENITVDGFIDNHLPKSSYYYNKNGRLYGPSPYEYFIGDPRTEQSYGCMAPTIQRAINHYYGNTDHTRNETGMSLPELCETYIAKDQPVLVWVTIGMVETYPGQQWYFEDGTLFSWPVNEHCMMLVGYDATHYYFNDPYTGKLKKYPHWICEDRYTALGEQAIVVVK